MAKQQFNEAELFLIQQWSEAVVLEDAMAKVREKNEELLQKIGKVVLDEHHGELDIFTSFFKQSWAGGSLMFSRKQWPCEGSFSAGLWLDNLGLDCLTSEEKDAPEAYVWVRPARRKYGLDVAAAQQKLWQELPKLLTAAELQACHKYEDDKDSLVGWFVSSKQEVLGWMIAGEERKLTECIQDQVATFVKLVPVLNDLLASGIEPRPADSIARMTP